MGILLQHEPLTHTSQCDRDRDIQPTTHTQVVILLTTIYQKTTKVYNVIYYELHFFSTSGSFYSAQKNRGLWESMHKGVNKSRYGALVELRDSDTRVEDNYFPEQFPLIFVWGGKIIFPEISPDDDDKGSSENTKFIREEPKDEERSWRSTRRLTLSLSESKEENISNYNSNGWEGGGGGGVEMH